MAKLSASMLRMLGHVYHDRPIYSHCKTQSDYGPLRQTLSSLQRRGLVSVALGEIRITPLGRTVYKQHKGK